MFGQTDKLTLMFGQTDKLTPLFGQTDKQISMFRQTDKLTSMFGQTELPEGRENGRRSRPICESIQKPVPISAKVNSISENCK